MNEPARVFIVDDHPLVRDAIAGLVVNAGMTVSGEASDPRVALRKLAEVPADLVIVDLSLSWGHGVDLIKLIRGRFEKLPVLVLTMHEKADYAEKALRAGAQGFVTKQDDTGQILTAIERVLAGELYLSPRISTETLQRLLDTNGRGIGSPVSRLTDRELQVFVLIGKGRSTTAIAQELGVSGKTVESHRSRIRRRLALEPGARLMDYATRWSLHHPSG